MNADEFLMSGGVKSASFLEIGKTVTGTITREPEVRQQTDFDTGKPLTWDDGTPRMQLMVVLQTTERDPANPEDDGQRAVYVKGQMKSVVRDAVRQAGAPGLKVGGTLTVTYVANGVPKRAGGKPPKQYSASYTAPAATAANDFLNGGEPQQAVPAQPVPQAAPAFAPQAPAPVPPQPVAPAPQPAPQAAPAAPASVPAGVGADALAALQALTPEQRAALGL